MKNLQARQGDVFLKQIKKLPDNLTAVKEANGRFILAEGEATGHAHAIRDIKNTMMFFDKELNKLYITVIKPVQLEHEEHTHVTLPLGNYEVIRQREYSPKEIRQVAD